MALKGLKVLTKRIEVFTDDLAHRKAQQVANDMLDTALFLVPVDTGWLKKNIKTEITKIKDGYRVTLYVDLADVPYSIYVELGTYKMVAQPYIFPAVLTAFHRNF